MSETKAKPDVLRWRGDVLEVLRNLCDRVDRARAILTSGNPTPMNNWGLLDTQAERAAIANAEPVNHTHAEPAGECECCQVKCPICKAELPTMSVQIGTPAYGLREFALTLSRAAASLAAHETALADRDDARQAENQRQAELAMENEL